MYEIIDSLSVSAMQCRENWTYQHSVFTNS